MKNHAKEYLSEFAEGKDNWLRVLIYATMEANGKIPEVRINQIFQYLSGDSENLKIDQLHANHNNSKSKIYITKLYHKQGVNALADNQTIKFHEEITILNGLNGAGKSGYFRILNEVTGGSLQKPILANIHTELNNKCIDASVSFQEEGKESDTINLKDKQYSFNLLNNCKIFDSLYSNGLLEKREADSALINPLGLHLFSYIVSAIDNLKKQLDQFADKKKAKKPTLDMNNFQDQIKLSFDKHDFDFSVRKKVEKLYIFSDEDKIKLNEIRKKLTTSKQINIQDKIKLQQSDKNHLDKINEHIQSTHQRFTGLENQVSGLVIRHQKYLEKNKSAKKKFEILTNIPSNNTNEWKEFIKAGDQYSLKLENKEENCPYCRQSFQDDSIKLVKTYGKFLKDESEQDLVKSKNKITELKKTINAITTKFSIEENIESILMEQKLENSEDTLLQNINYIVNEFKSAKEKLITILEEKNSERIVELPSVDQILKKLNLILIKIQNKINDYSQEDSEKEQEIKKFEEEKNKFLENQFISDQKENIKKWFEIDDNEKELRKKSQKITTTELSKLSTKAHQELVTDKLRDEFTKELLKLIDQPLNVKVEKAGSSKGIASTKLTIKKGYELKTVLSEGEQKAVTLALFIAEAKIQKSKNPVILDDPVNSLDHKIVSKFAESLLTLDNQIILFNHSDLFLNAFETSGNGHVCKTNDSDCSEKNKGKHIKIYQVQSEGENTKGVIANYKGNNAQRYLEDACTALKKSPFEGSTSVAIHIRKAVECIIDTKIFRDQTLIKHSNKNNHINWNELWKMGGTEEMVNILKKIHNRVSGGELHNGIENSKNPIGKEEFKKMIIELKGMLYGIEKTCSQI